MEKRYQIFISSTFADLIEERKAIMEAILDLNGFPAGMEMFPANDSEQFGYIKTIIDESDYYVLVIAGRYGSLADDGISYTEKEYDYAVEKGIPVLVFIRDNADNIAVKNTDDDSDKKKKLEAFKYKAMKNKLAKSWNTVDQLKYAVSSSLLKIFKTNPKTGWIRGDIENNTELLNQINKLRVENEKLNQKNIELIRQNEQSLISNNYDIDIESLASGDSLLKVNFEYLDTYFGEDKDTMYVTWNDIVGIIGPRLNEYKSDKELKSILESGLLSHLKNSYDDDELYADEEKTQYSYLKWITINDLLYNKIKIQLIALGIIKEDSGHITLTDKGYRDMISSMAIKKLN